MEVDYEDLGKRIRRERHKQELTQEKLAELINKSPKHISNIETGSTKVSLVTLLDIANALQTTIDYLLINSLEGRGKAYNEAILNLFKDEPDHVKERLFKYVQVFFDMHLNE